MREPNGAQRPDLTLEVAVGDILQFGADVVAFKYAEMFRGADRAAAKALEQAGVDIRQIQPGEGDVALIETRHALAAPRALFVGVPGLNRLRYSSIRLLAFTVLRTLRQRLPQTEHLAMTIHGPGFGLDEVEALLSQVAGFIEALQIGESPPALRRITIVDHRPGRVDLIREALTAHRREIPGAFLVAEGAATWSLSIPSSSARAIPDQPVPDAGLLERTPDEQQHIFVALPFTDPMRDLFRYGIQKPARDAGFLCEHFADQPFVGDVLENIKKRIASAAAVIGVLTDENPNVFLEVGYSWGVGRPTILVYAESREAPFDVQGQRHVRYGSIGDLEDKLAKELQGLRDLRAF